MPGDTFAAGEVPAPGDDLAYALVRHTEERCDVDDTQGACSTRARISADPGISGRRCHGRSTRGMIHAEAIDALGSSVARPDDRLH